MEPMTDVFTVYYSVLLEGEGEWSDRPSELSPGWEDTVLAIDAGDAVAKVKGYNIGKDFDTTNGVKVSDIRVREVKRVAVLTIT